MTVANLLAADQKTLIGTLTLTVMIPNDTQTENRDSSIPSAAGS
jgi:hypothetical protein